MSSPKVKPIIIVTGANGGVGLAVCERLLFQLLHKSPPDALPPPLILRKLYPNYPEDVPTLDATEVGHDGLTIIMACRSVRKAEAAREQLYRKLDAEVTRVKSLASYDGHAEAFRSNVEVFIEPLDLTDMKSVFKFSDSVKSKYPYISHLVCNAGVLSMTGLDWWMMIKQFCTEPFAALTSPLYKLQRKGELSVDRLGYVFQANVFGHYALYREVKPKLERYHSLSKNAARVLWASSVEAVPSCYDPKDWQLLDNIHSYEATKYQMDLLAGTFEAREQNVVNAPVRHLLEHPGVVKTNILTSSVNNVLLETLAQIFFLLVRIAGSPSHVISTYKAAISAVHLILIPMAFLITTDKDKTPLKFAAQSTRFGKAYVDTSPVRDWKSRSQDGEGLVDKCEALYQEFLSEQGKPASNNGS